MTPSVEGIDKASDDLSGKIKADEQTLYTTLEKIGELLRDMDELRRRISSNKQLQERNNQRLDALLMEMAETEKPDPVMPLSTSAVATDSQMLLASSDVEFDMALDGQAGLEQNSYWQLDQSISSDAQEDCI